MRKDKARLRELGEVARRAFELPLREQLELYAALRDALAEHLEESDADEQVAERTEALEVMEKVARALELEPGTAPSATQLREQLPKIDARWNVTRLGRAFGRLRMAQRAFTGERVPRTAASRAHMRRVAGVRHKLDPPLTAVRAWLATNPPDDRHLTYQEWALRERETRPEGETVPPSHAYIKTDFGLRWPDVLRVARGEADLRDLQLERLEQATVQGFVTLQYIVLREGISTANAQQWTRRPGFPEPAFVVKDARVWYRDQVDAFLDGRPLPRHRPHDLSARVVGYDWLEKALGRSGLRNYVHHERWDLIPPPAGTIGQRHFWWKRDVERWMKENPAEKRASIGKSHPRQESGS